LADSPFIQILRAQLRSLRRAAGKHAFTIIVLGPMIVGGFYFILEPTLERLSSYLQRAAPGWTDGHLDAAALLLAGTLVAGGLAPAVRNVFAVRSAAGYLDALPVAAGTKLHAALAAQLALNVPAFTAVWLLTLILARVGAGDPATPMLLPAAVLATLVQCALALTLVRVGGLGRLRLALFGAAVLALVWISASTPWVGWIAAPLKLAAEPLAAVLRSALGREAQPPFAAGAIGFVGLYALVRWGYFAWRDEYRERAEASASRARLLPNAQRRWEARIGRPAAAQLTRDLRLTLRGFSPAVYVAGAAALLCELAGVSAWLGGWIPAQWMPMFLLLCLALATLSLSAIAPLLLEFELPRMWLEQGAGVDPATMWKSKMFLAGVLSCPAYLATVAVIFGYEADVFSAAYLAFRALLVWLTTASVIGVLAFEIAPAPILGMLLGGVFAVGLSGMYAIADVWPVGLFLYAYLMNGLMQRATATASRLGGEA